MDQSQMQYYSPFLGTNLLQNSQQAYQTLYSDTGNINHPPGLTSNFPFIAHQPMRDFRANYNPQTSATDANHITPYIPIDSYLLAMRPFSNSTEDLNDKTVKNALLPLTRPNMFSPRDDDDSGENALRNFSNISNTAYLRIQNEVNGTITLGHEPILSSHIKISGNFDPLFPNGRSQGDTPGEGLKSFRFMIHPGLDLLMRLDTLLVSSVNPVLMHICDQEVYRPYGIYDHLGQRLFLCGETGKSNCSGQNRPFKLIIFNTYGQSLAILERSCNFCLCVCGSHVLGSKVKVSSALTNQLFGTVIQACSSFTPKFEVLDSSDDLLLSVEGHSCASFYSSCCLGPGACCNQSDFDVMFLKNQHKYQVGLISKRISCCGISDDGSGFTWLGTTFLPNLEPIVKLLLLATLFCIEISYYETNCSRRLTTQQFRAGSCCNKLDICCVQSCICLSFYLIMIIAIILIILHFGYGILI